MANCRVFFFTMADLFSGLQSSAWCVGTGREDNSKEIMRPCLIDRHGISLVALWHCGLRAARLALSMSW